ncbi:MAG: 5'-nucleotidase C-terminal domain-containing protein [Woeseiaceae bacterium]|nr:5'-nucleotidase C-terminal domain-containing protein [Woeseiaceae bacterium]
MNRFLSLLLVVVVLLAACSDASDTNDAPASAGLTFIHLNDTYRIGDVDSGRTGGFGRVVTVIRELRAEGRDVRILHGGDFLYPSLESALWDGMQMIDALNFLDALAPLYVVAGNHEFDRRRPKQLAAAMRASTFDWLGDNYELMSGDAAVDSMLQSGFVVEHDGRRIGIFAITLHADEGGNERDYVPIDPDYLGAARRALAEFDVRDVDLIVGLTHLHIWQDMEIAKLKAEYPQFLFIAGGHEHEPEFEIFTAASAAIVKGASNARTIWRIDVDFAPDGTPRMSSEAVELGPDIEQDPEYETLAAGWRARLLEKFPFLTARIGEAAVVLDGREVTVRNTESNWANFIVDQMRGAFGREDADLAFINSGTLRIDDFIAGDITFEDIGRTFGFSSLLRYTTLSGAEFRATLENGYRGSGPSKGYFPQVSGFRVCVDRSRPEGDRIVSLQLPADDGWQEISPGTDYDVVVTDFLWRGGDGYTWPAGRKASRAGSELKYLVLDAVMAAQASGQRVGEEVDPLNPRIVILDESRRECWP